MGLGLKILLFGGGSLLIAYYCIKKSVKKTLGKQINPALSILDPQRLQNLQQLRALEELAPVHNPQHRGRGPLRVGPLDAEEI